MAHKKHKPATRVRSKQRADPAPPSRPTDSIEESGKADARKRRTWIIATAIAALTIVSAGIGFLFLKTARTTETTSVRDFVGSETCAGCHQAEATLWRGSQHRLATEAARH